jgi:hypothetical protein
MDAGQLSNRHRQLSVAPTLVVDALSEHQNAWAAGLSAWALCEALKTAAGSLERDWDKGSVGRPEAAAKVGEMVASAAKGNPEVFRKGAYGNLLLQAAARTRVVCAFCWLVACIVMLLI